MRHVWRVFGLCLLVEGVLCANGITGCSFSPGPTANQCYSAQTLFTAPLPLQTLTWGNAFGEADIIDVPGQTQNPHPVSALSPWTTNIAGINVGVNVGADFTGSPSATLARVDNEIYVWDPKAGEWVAPQFSPDPTLRDDFTYAGHFSAPGKAGVTGDGAELLAMFNNNLYGTGSYVITFDQGIHAAGLLLSVQSAKDNIDFDATIKAYDRNSNLLATYLINTTGVGGRCESLSNTITEKGVTQPNPTPCGTNGDAPFIGIQAPGDLNGQQIYKIVISATSEGKPDSVLLGSLQFQEAALAAPEPAVILLCGAGLVLIGVLRRKQSAAGGSRA